MEEENELLEDQIKEIQQDSISESEFKENENIKIDEHNNQSSNNTNRDNDNIDEEENMIEIETNLNNEIKIVKSINKDEIVVQTLNEDIVIDNQKKSHSNQQSISNENSKQKKELTTINSLNYEVNIKENDDLIKESKFQNDNETENIQSITNSSNELQRLLKVANERYEKLENKTKQNTIKQKQISMSQSQK